MHCLFYLPHLLIFRIYTVDSKLLNIRKVFFQKIIFFIICVGESASNIYRQKYCMYGWNRLFQKSGVCRKACKRLLEESILVISDIGRNKLSVEIYNKPEKAKK